jgi:hypothetical protein
MQGHSRFFKKIMVNLVHAGIERSHPRKKAAAAARGAVVESFRTS